MSENKIIRVEIETDPTERIENEEILEIGQWYWVKDQDRVFVRAGSEDYDPDLAEEEGEGYSVYEDYEWLGCVTHLGSNVMEVTRAGSKYSSTMRIHLNEAHETLRPEPNWREVVQDEVIELRQEVERLMGEVKSITARLGVSPRLGLPAPQADQSYALATLSGTDDVSSYETALVRAKEKELPDLFKEIKNTNEAMAQWMQAETIPLLAVASSMKSVVSLIEDRIFNVSLYAGLTEKVCKVRDGKPASYDEKLRLLQRKHYMDEECLANYRSGGMDFDSIHKFDEWLAEDENFERLFPFPRCMVAFQVRRDTKPRTWGGDPVKFFVKMQLEDADRKTYLYIRNGEQLYWLGCDLDFGPMIFPERGEGDFGKPLMVKKGSFKEYTTITVDDYEVRCEKEALRQREIEKWNKDNPFKKWKAAKQAKSKRTKWPWWKNEYEQENPHYEHSPFEPDKWHTFDQSYLYYDEVMEKIATEIKYYNRVALIIQGLYDRSEVLHPHPPVKTWTPEGFASAIELVYDGSFTLYDGDPPSFEDYVARCNESINADSVLIGQDEIWQRRSAVKENKRRANDWRRRGEYERSLEFYKPYGNPGPGFIARPARWQKRAQKATFTWMRDRQRYNCYGNNDPLPTKIVVPVEDLFNVSAYKPGDFKQFFRDPRTRRNYLQWAPALLTAEDYHAGNLEIKEPLA